MVQDQNWEIWESGRFKVQFVDASVQLIKRWIHFIFRISPSARSEFRAGQEDVAVTVVNLFSETTKEDETSVTAIIDNAVKGNSDGIAKYDGKY